MYVRPALDSAQPTTFGVSGKLWRSALVMYDRQTLSLWSQIDGKSMAGPSAGATLTELPSQLTTWSDWRRLHPETLVLVKPPLEASPYQAYHERDFVGLPWFENRDRRLPEKTLVLGLERRDAAVAIPIAALDEATLLPFELAGEALLAIAPASSRTRLVVVRPRFNDQALEFVWWHASDGPTAESDLRDLATGSRWDWQRGKAVAGPLTGMRLEPVAASPIYWGIWSRFYPKTEICSKPNRASEPGGAPD